MLANRGVLRRRSSPHVPTMHMELCNILAKVGLDTKMELEVVKDKRGTRNAQCISHQLAMRVCSSVDAP